MTEIPFYSMMSFAIYESSTHVVFSDYASINLIKTADDWKKNNALSFDISSHCLTSDLIKANVIASDSYIILFKYLIGIRKKSQVW